MILVMSSCVIYCSMFDTLLYNQKTRTFSTLYVLHQIQYNIFNKLLKIIKKYGLGSESQWLFTSIAHL